MDTAQKNEVFTLRISSVNVTKSGANRDLFYCCLPYRDTLHPIQCLPCSISSTQRRIPNIIPPVILGGKMVATILEDKKSWLSINYHVENVQSHSTFKGTN